MNKPFYIFLFFILFCCEAKTQTEYITNGSFEQIDSCYGNFAPIGLDVFEWSGCKGWSNPIASSSDLWCFGGIKGVFYPPLNPPGYQFARTGNNFAGFYIGYAFYANYREYVQNNLSQPLKKNQIYNIEFYLSAARMPCTTSKFSVKFFNSKYSDMATYWLTNFSSDAENDDVNFITDTLGWQKVSMRYKAAGNENYIVIGCFADSSKINIDNDCDTTGIGSYIPGIGYFFIDDVSIIEIEMPELPNVFTPNGDNVNDVFKLTNCGAILNTSIYNRWGNLVFQTENQNHFWDGRTTSGEECVDGIYYYIIETKEKTLKGFLQLIR